MKLYTLNIRMVTDKKTDKPRGYAFIEYMHSRGMKNAYKEANGRKVDNRKVVVDVERGRTVQSWRPRRLGGGLGSSRNGCEEVNQKHSDRDKGKSPVERYRVRDERSKKWMRDQDYRDRHRDKERDHGQERDRGRDRGRDRFLGRDRGRDYAYDWTRDKEQELDKYYDHASYEKNRGYSHYRDAGYDHVESKHDRERPRARERNLDHGQHDYEQEWYDEPMKHGPGRDYGHSEQPQCQEYDEHLGPLSHEKPGCEPADRGHLNDTRQTAGYQSQFDHGRYELEEGERVEDLDYGYQNGS